MMFTFSRRRFLAALFSFCGLSACSRFFGGKTVDDIPGEIRGASVKAGHLLREGKFPQATRIDQKKIVIVGGGIAGLSAGWRLQKKGENDFLILELGEQSGGNSSWSANEVSPYPWGAHYVPLPGKEAVYVRELFQELGIIVGYDNKQQPIYNDLYLCSAPFERLYIHGQWQDGLMPRIGITAPDREQYSEFFGRMKRYKAMQGSDGRRAFAIPVDLSSQDKALRDLDSISMKHYLDREGFTSQPLLWYLNYCCRDDYGAGLERVSAWAGIHYFAARDGESSNGDDSGILTWPAGNGWIAEQLRMRLEKQIRCNAVVYRIEERDRGCEVDYYNVETKECTRIQCAAVVYAAPRFTARYVMPARASKEAPPGTFEYAPWMVANVTLSSLPEDSPQGTAWDNVMYKSTSLGYVSATHQSLGQQTGRTVWTYYHPLDEMQPAEARRAALGRSYEEWRALIVKDLVIAHRDILERIERIDVWLWGHGMIVPKPGFIWGEARKAALQPQGRIFFAHSDMSGISIFEEAQYHGVQAADGVLQRLQETA